MSEAEALLLEEKKKALKHGTTTVGLICSDGVVLAADKRASMGYFIANKETEKIHKLDDQLGMTIAGMVADAQALVRIMKAEAQLYKLAHGKNMSVSAASSLLANLMYQYKFYPFYVQLLLGGYDDKPRIYNLDPLGGVTEEKFVSTGSGSPMVYGLLEDQFKAGATVKDNLRLAIRCLNVAMKRDVATGDGIDLVAITKGEYKRFEKDEVKKLAAGLEKE